MTPPPHPPAWGLAGLRPLRRTPERRLRIVEARRGPISPPQAAPRLRTLPLNITTRWGDLGVEVELERLPMVQKDLIREAQRAGVFTITATEMLESMVTSSRPTRAEVTDVANAILDGTDAVMLSAETAVGRYSVEAVTTMSRIAAAVEVSEQYRGLPKVIFRDSEPTFSNAIALAAVRVADALGLTEIKGRVWYIQACSASTGEGTYCPILARRAVPSTT